MTDREKAIDKIQKLLALANGTDKEGEMKNAMKLAKAFLRKHDLEMSDVEIQEEVSDMTTESGMEFTRTYQWIWYMSSAIDCICNTDHFRSGRGFKFRMHFCGTKNDVATATELFKFLFATIQRMGKEIGLPGIKERNSYCNGIGYRLHNRAEEMVREEEAENEATGAIEGSDGARCKDIICLKKQELSTYMAETHDVRTAKTNTVSKDQTAFMMGVRDGANVPLSIAPGIEGK